MSLLSVYEGGLAGEYDIAFKKRFCLFLNRYSWGLGCAFIKNVSEAYSSGIDKLLVSAFVHVLHQMFE